jgi:hypothetical protein
LCSSFQPGSSVWPRSRRWTGGRGTGWSMMRPAADLEILNSGPSCRSVRSVRQYGPVQHSSDAAITLCARTPFQWSWASPSCH